MPYCRYRGVSKKTTHKMAMSVLAKVRAMKARGPILILRWVQLSIAVLILILAIYGTPPPPPL